jgi:hypothetical protein
VQNALALGELTLLRAFELSKLPLENQRHELQHWTNQSRRKSRGEAIAAAVITDYLRMNATVNLGELLLLIQVAASAGSSTAAF